MNPVFVKAIQEASTIILNVPEVLDLEQNQSRIYWLSTTPKINTARKQLREVLQEMWGNGAFNYDQVAKALRVDVQIVQALMDEEFIARYGL